MWRVMDCNVFGRLAAHPGSGATPWQWCIVSFFMSHSCGDQKLHPSSSHLRECRRVGAGCAKLKVGYCKSQHGQHGLDGTRCQTLALPTAAAVGGVAMGHTGSPAIRRAWCMLYSLCCWQCVCTLSCYRVVPQVHCHGTTGHLIDAMLSVWWFASATVVLVTCWVMFACSFVCTSFVCTMSADITKGQLGSFVSAGLQLAVNIPWLQLAFGLCECGWHNLLMYSAAGMCGSVQRAAYVVCTVAFLQEGLA